MDVFINGKKHQLKLGNFQQGISHHAKDLNISPEFQTSNLTINKSVPFFKTGITRPSTSRPQVENGTHYIDITGEAVHLTSASQTSMVLV
jgi:short subunit dehydrogenase-like uncharacterized protein